MAVTETVNAAETAQMQPEEYSVIRTGQQKDADNACYDVVQSVVVVVVVLLSLIWLFNKQQQQQPQHYKALAERTDEHEYSAGRVRPPSLSLCEDASLERLELAVRQRQKLFTFCGGSCCLFVCCSTETASVGAAGELSLSAL